MHGQHIEKRQKDSVRRRRVAAQPRRRLNPFLLTAGVAAIILSASLAIYSHQQLATPPPEPPKAREVHAMARKLVREKLSVPRTSKMSGADETTIQAFADGGYEVKGWVDAQNKVGSLLRKRYTIRLHRSETGEEWTADAVAFDSWKE